MNPVISTTAVVLTALILIAATGCSSVDSRIKDHQAAFNAAPPVVQTKIRAGQVEVGFTPEQVTMALGTPDRSYTRTTARGTSEIWAYEDRGPAINIGFGMMSGAGGSMIGSGVAIGSGGDRNDDKVRVIFEDGRVAAIEMCGRR